MKTSSSFCSCGACPLKPPSPALGETPLRLALVGTPNCGKTALFNALTGSRQKVANYAGVTVESKEGIVRALPCANLLLIDLPGTMSLRARSPDERVTRETLLAPRNESSKNEALDAILCVGDATNLRATLRLVLELKEIGLPILLAVNMMDSAQAAGLRLDLPKLAARLGVPVVGCAAVVTGGLRDLLAALCQEVPLWQKRAPAPCLWHEPDAARLRALAAQTEDLFSSVLLAKGTPASLTDKIDKIMLHPALGLGLLLVVLFLMFQAIFSWAEPIKHLLDGGLGLLAGFVQSNLPDTLFRAFLTKGLIAGVGSVLVFLPQMMLLFLFIILLEDFGYMARAAFLMDRVMGSVGLFGRAFIPLLSSFACAIPGILAARTIENRKDRLTTILIAPFMTCSARLPVYTLIIGAMVPETTVAGLFRLQGLVMFALYLAGIAGGLLVAFVLKRGIFKGASEPLMLSLPNYQRPRLGNVAWGVWLRAGMFVRRAGGLIFFISMAIWFLSTFPLPPEGAAASIETSYAGLLGHLLAPLLRPLGFSWEMTLSLIPALSAREVAVASLGTIYAVSGPLGEPTQSLSAALQTHWSLASALSYLTWFVFAPQCLPTFAVMKRETGSWRWPAFSFALMLTMAYLAAFGVYRAALLF